MVVCLLMLGGGGKCMIELERGEGGKRGSLIKVHVISNN